MTQPAGFRPPLTSRQQQVLNFINAYMDQKNYPPTIREIGKHLEIKSTNGVTDHLKALIRKGYLKLLGKAKSRAYIPTDRPTNSIIETHTSELPPLSKRQQQAYELIKESMEKRGFAPTLREFMESMGINSTNGITDHLVALEKKGYIVRVKGVSRGIQLTQVTKVSKRQEG